MSKIEDIEKARESIDKFIEFLEKIDRFKRSYTPIQNGINWFLGLSAGCLIWFLANLNTFKVDNSSTSKYTVLTIVISFGISTLIFGMARLAMLLREIAMNASIDFIQTLPDKFILRKEELDEKEIDEKFKEYLGLWHKGHNLIIVITPILKLGFMSFVFGLILMVIHVIRYTVISS